MIEWLQERHAEITQSLHHAGNMIIDFVGAHLAIVETSILSRQRYALEARDARVAMMGEEVGASPDVLDMQGAGRYVDVFEQREGQWKIARRTCIYEGIWASAAPDLPTLNQNWPLARRDRTDPLYRELEARASGRAMTADSSIEARLQRLEDIESVHRLMATYHQLCDGWTEVGTHKDPAAIARLFTEDGEWAVTARQPPPKGPEQIASMARELQAIPWIVHFVVNPMVDVDGDTATATFKGVIRRRHHPEDDLSWNMGIYHLHAVRTADGWRMKRLGWESMIVTTPFDPASLSRD
jgi:ketosteroid isomerase-like protein